MAAISPAAPAPTTTITIGARLESDAVDERQHVGQVDAVRVGHTRAEPVGHVRVHGEDDVGAGEDVRPPRVSETHAALSFRRIRRELDELVAVNVAAAYESRWSEIAGEQEYLLRPAAAAHEALHAVADDLDGCSHRQRID